MQFRVPQFIEVEDKIFGPLSFKQFIYLAGGVGIMYVLYRALPIWISIFLIIPVGILAGLLTFYKVNGKPFVFYLQAGLNYIFSSKLFIWKQRLVKPEDKKKEEVAPVLTSVVPMTTTRKLKDLAWSLDIQEQEKSR
jgi:hypothetical protein